MAELKTRPNDRDVEKFLDSVTDERRRRDARTILNLMRKTTKAEPRMWGDSMVGFGSYHYKYETGREGDWFVTGFSPRRQNLTLYLMAGFHGCDDLLKKLGKHKVGKSCLYLKSLDDIHLPTLRELVKRSVKGLSKSLR